MTRTRPGRPSPVPAAALAAALAALLTGCGITPTGPVPSGGPATGVTARNEADAVRLYFASPHGIRQASRPATGTATPQRALDLLLEGPTENERARGLANHVPPLPKPPVAVAGTGTVDVYLPVAVATGELDTTALSQIVCTLAHTKTLSDAPPDRVTVKVHETSVRTGNVSDQGWPLRCGPQSLAVPAGQAAPPP
ncbi:GerMN domain-containing protein [Streptomyces sp. IBSNAI002]|uniref:GerMN domain-containing protein n=1 Tax=Streptomyces sp. IBSNAI002 TaxID=3457500 RepID=UPI003FCF072D